MKYRNRQGINFTENEKQGLSCITILPDLFSQVYQAYDSLDYLTELCLETYGKEEINIK